jgi:methylated-DNA-[protein]-cysteine S-methyltransferase
VVTTLWTLLPSPIGDLLLTATDAGLTGVQMGPAEPLSAAERADHHPILAIARRELDGYFAGELTSFTVALAAVGTVFQRRVWAALRAIPFGTTTSYGALARALGRRGAARAVGLANGRNPIAIIVPCHRVIGADGTLTGYGGGLERKRWLLAHEETLSARARGRLL